MDWNTNFHDPEVIGNYLEACFWMACGIAVLVIGLQRGRLGKWLPILSGMVFLVFGLSDVVEAQTGAWWRPLWLLAWKGLCLLVLAGCYWRYRQARRLRQVTASDHKA
jgi:uncharacterized membrane protein HdeD (DUF308 family)